MMQCSGVLVCEHPAEGGGMVCGTRFYCLREEGHSGRHNFDRWHECWHGRDVWCKAELARARPEGE